MPPRNRPSSSGSWTAEEMTTTQLTTAERLKEWMENPYPFMSPAELAKIDAAARAREEEDEEEERRKEEEEEARRGRGEGDESESGDDEEDRKGRVINGNGYTMHKDASGTVRYGGRHDVVADPALAAEGAERWDGGLWSWGDNTGSVTGGRQTEIVENTEEGEDKVEKPETKAQPQQDDDDISSITSTTIPFYDSGSDGPAENKVDPELERVHAGPEPPVVNAGIDGATAKPLTSHGNMDDSASELTAFTDESEGEANDEDDNEDDDDDDDEEEEEEEVEVKPGEGSVPPPNVATNATTKSSPAQGGQKPLSARKPSIFGPRSDEPDAQDDGEESELTDSDVESTLTATTKNKTVINTASNGNKVIKPISIKVTPAKSTEGDDNDAEDEDEPMTPGTTAVRVSAPRRSSNAAGDDEEKPYSPPKTAKKGILGRSAAGQAEGETESIVSDDEEEDEDEGGQGMLVKDAVRRESEGKAKQTREDDEDDEDKGVAEERSVEGRAASPSSTKSKRVSATPAPSSTSHLITNNLSSATTQTTLEALQSLLQIEVKFAALRDQLYVERMDELSREEEVIADGSHPSLLHLHQILQDRRENLLHLAELRLKQNELELVRVRESDKKAVMSWWQDAKDTLVRDEYESNARKKRRLDKDKADYEIIKPAPRALPPKMPTRLDAEARTFGWERGPSITALMQDEVANDLAKIGAAARSQYRQLHHGHRQQHVMAGYGRYAGEDSAMMTADTGSLLFDPTGARPIANGAGHHHHVVPAASGSSQATGSRHRHYAQTSAAYDLHNGAGQPHDREREPRREGRQIPTSNNSEPFDPRRRDRMEDPLLTGRIRRDVGPDDARDPKRRKTGSDSPAPINGLGGHASSHVVPAAAQDDPRRIPRRSPSPSQGSKPNALKVNPADGQSAGYSHPGGNASVAPHERSLGWDYRWNSSGSSRYPYNPRRPVMAAARN